ncbi:PREDICTED: myotubularin-related protein 9 [Papilio polytes]|uniref:myotubularin-related protein 9 n=1 Tax=Papilio polytes TaxID=76194 RepID=UPI000675FA46|nr:PREDICTED: myotubularin-related protein 9 [Papilio polytes]
MEFIELILINKLDGVILKYPHHDNVDGTVCITGHHLILSSRKEGVRELWLLHKNIDSIEKKENKPINGMSQGGSLFLKCKDLRIFQLDIGTTTELNLVAQTLENLSNIQDPSLFYPFFYRHMHPIVENGYTLYSIEGEFTKVLASEEWRVSRVNQNYTVCPGYPKAVVVPKSIDDETLAAAASFRQGGRFPVLSYRHNNGAVLLRAGQPLSGPKHRRCRPDEAILNSVVNVGMKGIIYDLRSSNAISQQQNKGGGSESAANYSQWKIYNRSMDDVDNQQQLLESFSKLIEACVDKEISSDKWISRLEWCGWPEAVRNALHTACIVAQHLHQKAEPVLVHGTRGEDATLLVCSLVQIILNLVCNISNCAGTFLCDSEQERAGCGVYAQTTSVWSWLNRPEELAGYINPLYEPTHNVIWPSVAPMSFVIWEELYLRWLTPQGTEEREEQYRAIRSREQQLRAQAQLMRRELFDLAQQYYSTEKVGN